MANNIPVRGNYRGLAARVRLLALYLASAMMIVGLSCSLALYAIKKTGRDLTASSSSSLLHSCQRFMGFLADHPLAVLCLLFFFTLVYTMFDRIKIWQRSRRQASTDRSDEVRDIEKKGSTCREEELREWDFEEGMKPAKLKELSTRHIWDPETGASIKLPKWGIVP
ncbi:hypothetical protein COCNU_06G001050 [Cocos nucifera]|uniref:Uncharacterized protein n=1 Tax=Cocos nucifera TaxID=13894 RepID=A0A8K0IB27_COCNU|nr:hypothetical protein COCNU_06G001050 [Cocos nucifera]